MAGPNAPTRYPTGGDYVDALQHPAAVFTDPQLRTGTVKADSWGLPDPVSGNFASVFQVVAADGSRWAIKCFTRPVADQQRRYQAVSAALRQLKHPALVDFDYQSAGILIRGARYPLVKMRWVDAQGLLPWLETHRTDPVRLATLAGQLVDIVTALEKAGIAHGDLQHGNLLVTADTRLILIDYDGMYVPALGGLPPAEKGLPNYQHPDRGDHDFGPGLDRFSAWVIYTSLLALAVEPALWRRLRDTGDDTKILLAAADYTAPATSPAFRALRSTAHQPLTDLATALCTYAGGPLSQIPKLEPLKAPDAVPAPRASAPQANDDMPEWLTDHLPTTATTPIPTQAQAEAASTSDSVEPAAFGGGPSLTVARLATVTALAAIGSAVAGSAGVAALAAIPLIVWWLTAAAAAVFVPWAYRRHPQAVARRRAFAAYAHARAQVDRATDARDEVQRLIIGLDAYRSQQHQRIAQQRAGAGQGRQVAEQTAAQALRAALAQIQNERNAPHNGLNTWHVTALQRLREEHVQRALAGAVILRDRPSGIDTTVAGYLARSGFHTAADFVSFHVVRGSRYDTAMLRRTPQDRGVHVEQVGPVRAGHLIAWRDSILQQAERTAPTLLPADQRQSLAARHDQFLQALKAREQSARDIARAATTAAATQERHALIGLDQEQAKLEADVTAAHANHQRRLTGTTTDLSRATQTQQRHADMVTAYRSITFRRFLAVASGTLRR